MKQKYHVSRPMEHQIESWYRMQYSEYVPLMWKVWTIKMSQTVIPFSKIVQYKYNILWNYGIGQ